MFLQKKKCLQISLYFYRFKENADDIIAFKIS
jgi:hypothetical protein